MRPIPRPLEVSYLAKKRGIATAKISVRELDDGRFEQRIEHAPLLGITREMLFWWMHHIGDQVEFEGHRVLAYRLWHPSDHIHWHCDGPIEPGCKFHIVEAFQAQRRYLVDNVFDVPTLTPSGFRLVSRFMEIAQISVDEDWIDVPGGVQWTNTMQLTASIGILQPLVQVGRRFKMDMMTAWLTHNVEEVGFIPEFLPKLFAARPA